MRYTYLLTDLMSGAVLDELPLQQVSYWDEINGPGGVTATIPMYDSRLFDDARRRELRAELGEWQRGVYVLSDGVMQWGGVLTRVVPDGGVLSVTAAGFLAYFQRRYITNLLDYPHATVVSDTGVRWDQVDQLTIAEDLIVAAQGILGGDVLVEVDPAESGVLRDEDWEWTNVKSVGEALLQLAQVEGGFDASIDAYLGPSGEPRQRLVLSYPFRGRPVAQTGLLLEQPGNLMQISWQPSTIQLTTVMHAIGQGDGSAALRWTSTDASALVAGVPRLEDDLSLSDATSTTKLREHADAALDAARTPLPVPEVVVSTQDPPVAEYTTGDEVRLRITDPCHPAGPGGEAGIDLLCRIRRKEVRVPDSGEPTATLQLVDARTSVMQSLEE